MDFFGPQLHLHPLPLRGSPPARASGQIVAVGFFSSSSPREFCAFQFCHLKKDITELVKLQRRAAKLVKGKAKLPSEDSLQIMAFQFGETKTDRGCD